MSFTHIQTNSKDSQFTAVRAVDQSSYTIHNGYRGGGGRLTISDLAGLERYTKGEMVGYGFWCR